MSSKELSVDAFHVATKFASGLKKYALVRKELRSFKTIPFLSINLISAGVTSVLFSNSIRLFFREYSTSFTTI